MALTKDDVTVNASRARVALILDRLADGEVVGLGKFMGNVEPDAPADIDAAVIREAADRVRHLMTVPETEDGRNATVAEVEAGIEEARATELLTEAARLTEHAAELRGHADGIR